MICIWACKVTSSCGSVLDQFNPAQIVFEPCYSACISISGPQSLQLNIPLLTINSMTINHSLRIYMPRTNLEFFEPRIEDA